MTEFFTSDLFIDSSLAVLLTLLIYLITRALCAVQGMGKDEIVRVLKFLDKTDRLLSSFLTLYNKGTLDKEKARKLLLSIRIYIKNSASVLQVYLYEKEDKPKIRSAINKLNALETRCDNIAINYNNGKKEELEKTITGIRADLKKIISILNISKKEVEEDRKKVI